jgi:hypothetical protein
MHLIKQNPFIALYFLLSFSSVAIFYYSFSTVFLMMIDSALLYVGAMLATVLAVLFAYRYTTLAYSVLLVALAFSGHAPWHKYTLVLMFLVHLWFLEHILDCSIIRIN